MLWHDKVADPAARDETTTLAERGRPVAALDTAKTLQADL